MTTDRPIIFSAPMVRALLDGRKTQTRRILKNVPASPDPGNVVHKPKHSAPYLDSYCSKPKTALNPRGMSENWCWWTRDDRCGEQFKVRYVPGDRLWVRENARLVSVGPGQARGVAYPADGDMGDVHFFECPLDGKELYRTKTTPSIHMPRWASRITLHVTGVKVERLQDISEADAHSEGAELAGDNTEYGDERNYYEGFRAIWERINGPDAWAANPWVVAVTFRTIKANIDSAEARAA